MNDLPTPFSVDTTGLGHVLRPQHGGNVQSMADTYGIAVDQWLDVSTGIAPYSYPIPALPEHIWQRLPETLSSLACATHKYYGLSMQVVPGTQQCIQIMPSIWRSYNVRSTTVYLPKQGYKEHEFAWMAAGFCLRYYDESESLTELTLIANSVVVLINPNNPTGECLAREQVDAIHKRVAEEGGLLVVDEAFMDVIEPSQSLLAINAISPEVCTSSINTDELSNSAAIPDSLIVLRSFGKFFGLAGLRIGFVALSARWQRDLKRALGPWPVNGPAMYIAEQALQNRKWQQQQRQRLVSDAAHLQALLEAVFPLQVVGPSLFKTVYCNNAEAIHRKLCHQAINVRLLDGGIGLRFGCVQQADLPRLATGLEKACRN